MIQTFFLGFTSGCFLGFVLHWFFKKPLPSNLKVLLQNPESMASAGPNPTEELLTMVLCVNDDLKMTKGKAMAQCAHAAVGVYESYFKARKSIFEAWERQGKHISIFKVSDGSNLKSLNKTAESRNFITCLIKDAGRTQIPPGSITVLAIGPAFKSKLDCFTQYLLPYS